jgi:hypothetical protein
VFDKKEYNKNWRQTHRGYAIKKSQDWRLKNPQKYKDSYSYEKRKLYLIKRLRELKIKYTNMLGAKCSICGYNKCLDALEFHHIEGKKDYNYHKAFTTLSTKKILEDIKNGKVILLCANCHREQQSVLNINCVPD